jgi:hypothetical protein
VAGPYMSRDRTPDQLPKVAPGPAPGATSQAALVASLPDDVLEAELVRRGRLVPTSVAGSRSTFLALRMET